jgi:hypothetical protein
MRTFAVRRTRMRLADGLGRAMRSVQDPTHGFTAAVRPNVEETLAASSVMLAVERRLRSDEAVSPRGLAMVQALLTDGNSALYQPLEEGALGSQLRAAAAALEPDSR